MFFQKLDDQEGLRSKMLFAELMLGKYDHRASELFPADQLSGGERRRFGVARALFSPKPITIMDEPTSELDESTAKAAWKLIFAETSHGILFVASHDVDIVRQFDFVLHVRDGVVCLCEVSKFDLNELGLDQEAQ